MINKIKVSNQLIQYLEYRGLIRVICHAFHEFSIFIRKNDMFYYACVYYPRENIITVNSSLLDLQTVYLQDIIDHYSPYLQ